MSKRLFDATVSALLLIVSLPLWPLIAAAIRLTSRGPVLYRATRVGKNGEEFPLLKFRSMRATAVGNGPRVTAALDPRITMVGRWLRRWKLDELPQLINVLRGEMSVVGPRPEDPHYVAHYTDEQRLVLSVRPGLTSPAVLLYPREEVLLTPSCEVDSLYVTEILPAKLALDLHYVRSHSLWGDVSILARTLIAVLNSGRNPPTPARPSKPIV